MASPIVRYHHVNQNISRVNVDAALRFYSDVLGLTQIPAMGDPEGERLIWFALGENEQLHLVIHDSADFLSERHLAVLVDDFDQFIEHLRRESVRLDECEPGQFWGFRLDGAKYAFCYDPDGNRIELMERRRSHKEAQEAQKRGTELF
jgi:catechol 2,3-dioxygenase-like lactoylglutathione lyase family enzyme